MLDQIQWNFKIIFISMAITPYSCMNWLLNFIVTKSLVFFTFEPQGLLLFCFMLEFKTCLCLGCFPLPTKN